MEKIVSDSTGAIYCISHRHAVYYQQGADWWAHCIDGRVCLNMYNEPAPELATVVKSTESKRRSISGDPAFDRFCEISDEKMYQYIALIERTIAGIMREAGEDPENPVLLANRTRQLTFSLNSAAERKYSNAALAATMEARRNGTRGYHSWSAEERAEYDAMYDR